MTDSLSKFSHASSSVASTDERPHHVYEPEHYAQTRFVPFPKAFIELKNPLERVQSALVHLGPPPGTAPPTYTPDLSDPDEAPTEKQRRTARAKLERECCKITFAPGESKLIPRDLVAALVTVRDGAVIGGLLPYLVIPGDPTPPHLGTALLEALPAGDPFAVPAPGKSKGKQP